tara:strand:- start:57 stop:179 length:123 start_codon:yes stop_codon:yes gene_type:complete
MFKDSTHYLMRAKKTSAKLKRAISIKNAKKIIIHLALIAP